MTCKGCKDKRIKEFKIINRTLAAQLISKEKGGICLDCDKLLTEDGFQRKNNTNNNTMVK
ncbi:hypothetical protein QIA30_04860 (plasmid) [Borreliella turdi]|uniref:hypothetical protein n=1 Tax=Borreliella turdi TaxID=57863 RepID=UPI003AF020B1